MYWLLGVPCSHCGAARGERCRRPSGRLLLRPHKVRDGDARAAYERQALTYASFDSVSLSNGDEIRVTTSWVTG